MAAGNIAQRAAAAPIVASHPCSEGMKLISGTICLLPATLTGMGRRAKCEVLVRRRTTVSQGKIPQFGYTYTDCSIIHAPADLPDGDYVLRFGGFYLRADCRGGHWLPNGEPQRETEADSAIPAVAS